MKKKFFLIVFTLLACFFGINNYKAVTRTKMVDSDDVTVVNYGTSADSKYAYGFRVNKNSKITNTNVEDYNMIDVVKSDNVLIFVPQDESGSGKSYVFIEDVGKYNGKRVDLKVTYFWKINTIDNVDVHPYIELNLNKENGLINHYFISTGYEVKYEPYCDGKPLKVNMSLKLGDIDFSQYFGIKTNTGDVENIQAISGSEVYYENKSGYKWVYDGGYSDSETLDRKYSARFELGLTDSFNLIVGPGYDLYSFIDKFTPATLETINPNTNLPYFTEEYIKSELISENTQILSGNYTSRGVVTLEAGAYGPYVHPTPSLYIRDIDNVLKTSTIMNKLEDNVIYEAYNQVPSENYDFYYTGYEFEVDIPDDVTINSVAIYNESNDNVTDYFNIEHTGNKYTFKAKENILSDSKFYSDTYQYKFITKLTDKSIEEVKKDGEKVFTAVSKLTVSRGSNSTEEVSTNTVSTKVLYKKTYKVTTEVINGEIDDSVDPVVPGEDVTITYKPNSGYVISKIIIDGEEIEIGEYTDTYTFKNIDKDHTIKVIYEISNPKTGAFISIGALSILFVGFISFTLYSKRKNKFYKI